MAWCQQNKYQCSAVVVEGGCILWSTIKYCWPQPCFNTTSRSLTTEISLFCFIFLEVPFEFNTKVQRTPLPYCFALKKPLSRGRLGPAVVLNAADPDSSHISCLFFHTCVFQLNMKKSRSKLNTTSKIKIYIYGVLSDPKFTLYPLLLTYVVFSLYRCDSNVSPACCLFL